MRTFVIGHTGMIGSELVRRGYKPLKCDVTKELEVERTIKENDPDCIIYCAGFTDVDGCEKDAGKALAVNAWGVHYVLNHFTGKFLYISSDHVFKGHYLLFGWRGYTEKHSPSPVNIYGMTKLAAERLLINSLDYRIIRTSKLFDRNYVLSRIYTKPTEYSNIMLRSFLHVQHFVTGLESVLDNWNKIPIILNIAGTDLMSHYLFFSSVLRSKGYDPGLAIPRNKELKGETPRPIRAGLNVGLADKLGVPLYSTYDGIKLL